MSLSGDQIQEAPLSQLRPPPQQEQPSQSHPPHSLNTSAQSPEHLHQAQHSPPSPTPIAPPAAANTASTNHATEAPLTFTRNLNAGEELWVWKLGLRVFLIVVAIIGIGSMGWAVSTAASGPYSYELDDSWSVVWTLITFGISTVWCSVCALVLLIRKRPCHPGVAVGLDLVLWLAFIPTAMFAVIGTLSVINFGSDGVIGRYSSYGTYNLASNGTWVWNATEYDSYFQRDRDCSVDGRYSNRYSGYGFDSCEAEDAYVNALWDAKPNRARVEITGTVCQVLGLLAHLALFVWACVDTHRRNRRKVSKDAERLAGDIVMKMVKSGAIIPAQGQAGAYQRMPDMPQQVYGGGMHGNAGQWPLGSGPQPMGRAMQPMMPMQMQVPARGARGPPNMMQPGAFAPPPEKGDSTRFA